VGTKLHQNQGTNTTQQKQVKKNNQTNKQTNKTTNQASKENQHKHAAGPTQHSSLIWTMILSKLGHLQ